MFKKRNIFLCYVCIFTIVYCVILNSTSNFVLKDDVSFDNYNIEKKLIDNITFKDNDIYRITTLIDKRNNANEIFGNINMYQNYLYSSLYNIDYNKFYYDVFNNVMQSRNRLITSPNSNVLFLMFMNNRYLLGNNDILGYDVINSEGGINLYENKDVLPFMYVSYNFMNYNDFDNYDFPYNNEILLNSTISNEETNYSYDSKIIKLNDIDVKKSNIVYSKNDSKYEFSTDDNSYINFELPSYARDKIIFIKFKMNKNQSCGLKDQVITINGEKNTLTCKEWKYYNQNEEFTYVISNKNTTMLNVKFSKGRYSISDINLYYLDYNDINEVHTKITAAEIDKDKTSGDEIYAYVETIDDGYFVTSIPYQKGFSIFVDDKEVLYENINEGFVGFRIEKGKHNIKFEFNAPFKNVGICLSIIGIITFIVIMIYENKK